ncbi:MAG: sulfur carrier protein ThiS [Dehalococcoidia bacterium]|nr:sulfur carrier protein ThiS [Dehalococcoidia bacterium]
MGSTNEVIGLRVNSEPRELQGGSTATDLLDLLGIEPRLVAVAINGMVVRRSDLRSTVLSDGDEVEIVRAVGGG